jgi:hypothetical protein
MNYDITWSDCSGSKYLKQDDIDQSGVTVTINRYDKHMIEGRNGEPDREKVVVFFDEIDKPLVLNATNADAIKTYTRASTPQESIGKKLELFVDPTIAFAGKVVGGLRFRPLQQPNF